MFPTVLVLVFLPLPALGQSADLEDRAEAVIRAAYEAWNDADVSALASGSGWATGFGFRTEAPRGVEAPPPGYLAAALNQFFESLEYYRVTIDELNLSSHGDVVMAWGFHTEDFKHHGREPEVIRVRFSTTMILENGEFRSLLSHRDAQPFDAEGRYIPAAGGA